MTRKQIIKEAHLGNMHWAAGGTPATFVQHMMSRNPTGTVEEFHTVSKIGRMLSEILDYTEKEE